MQNLITRATDEIKPDIEIVLLTIVSAILATLGIVLDDQFVILGSMLVSPFLDPLISFVVFTRVGNVKNVFKSIRTFLLIFVIGLVTSVLLSYLLSFTHDLINVAYIPKIQLEYILVSIVLGVVGMLLWMWPQTSNTSAGIAIAISLMPPLANLGRSIVMMRMEDVVNSSISLSINITGLIIGAMLVLIFQKDKRLNGIVNEK